MYDMPPMFQGGFLQPGEQVMRRLVLDGYPELSQKLSEKEWLVDAYFELIQKEWMEHRDG